MKRISVMFAMLCIAGCSSSTGTTTAQDLSGVTQDLTGSPSEDFTMSTTADQAMASGMDSAMAACPPAMGNSLGVGATCTKGGGECSKAGSGLVCELDEPGGMRGDCIKIAGLSCAGVDCGTGATCCQTAMTQNIAVCFANGCAPPDCMVK